MVLLPLGEHMATPQPKQLGNVEGEGQGGNRPSLARGTGLCQATCRVPLQE